MWRSRLPVIYICIYLKRGGGVVILGKGSGGALRSSTFCCCISEIISFHNLFSVSFLQGISAEERRSGYEDVIFGCEYRSLMIGRSFVDAVSRFKMVCNSGDQPEYPLSHRVYVYFAFWCQCKVQSAIEAKSSVQKWEGLSQARRYLKFNGWGNRGALWCTLRIQEIEKEKFAFSVPRMRNEPIFEANSGFKIFLLRFHFLIVWGQKWPQIWGRFWPQKSGRLLRFSSVLWGGFLCLCPWRFVEEIRKLDA